MNPEQLARFIAFLESMDSPTPELLALIQRKRRELPDPSPEGVLS